MSKIALCFLVTKNLENLEIWEKWWEGNENKISIYVHYDKKGVTQDLLTENKIKKTVKTKWGDLSLVKAEKNLYEEALKDKDNKYFLLLSETCLPIREFSYVYRRLNRSPKGIISYNQWDPYGKDDDYVPFIDKPKCIKILKEFSFFTKVYTADQWKVLGRKNAIDFIKMTEDKKYKELFSAFCIEVVPDSVAPDELMFINYLKWKYKKLSKEIRQGLVTYVDFKEKDPVHPKSYKNLTKNLENLICDTNAMFARKFVNTNKKLKKNIPVKC